MPIRCSDENCNRLAKTFINPQGGRDRYYCDTHAQAQGYCLRCFFYAPPLADQGLCEHCRWSVRVWQEMQRVNWNTQDGKAYCQRNFHKQSRAEMDIQQLRQFYVHLRSISTPPTPSKKRTSK